MTKAILEIETPESCSNCPIAVGSVVCLGSENSFIILNYTESRHPDCPLVIEGKGLPMFWDESFSFTVCQKCKGVVGYEDSYCQHCGVKLAPPLEGES
jgi:hypothetical protein